MIGYRSFHIPKDVNPYTVSIEDNGNILPLHSSVQAGLSNNFTFNEPVIIGDNVGTCSNLFRNCRNFNQPVIIPGSVVNCSYMFLNCTNFNQSIVIPENVVNCSYMFHSCTNLRYEGDIYIPNTCKNISCMFMHVKNANIRNVYVGSSVTVMTYMFDGEDDIISSAYNKKINLYIYGKTERAMSVWSIFGSANAAESSGNGTINRSVRKNIFFNIALNSQFNYTNDRPIVGWNYQDASVNIITWTKMTNGYYNAYYNIYCYTNFSG